MQATAPIAIAAPPLGAQVTPTAQRYQRLRWTQTLADYGTLADPPAQATSWGTLRTPLRPSSDPSASSSLCSSGSCHPRCSPPAGWRYAIKDKRIIGQHGPICPSPSAAVHSGCRRRVLSRRAHARGSGRRRCPIRFDFGAKGVRRTHIPVAQERFGTVEILNVHLARPQVGDDLLDDGELFCPRHPGRSRDQPDSSAFDGMRTPLLLKSQRQVRLSRR